MARIRTACTTSVSDSTFPSRRGPATVVMDALVERPQRTGEPQALQERLRPAQERPGRAGEEQEAENERREDEDALEPEVGTHVVLADREQEPDGAERDGRCSSQAAFQEDGAGHDRRPPGMPSRRLDDANRISAE